MKRKISLGLLVMQLLALAACSGADENAGSLAFSLKPLQKEGGWANARMDCKAIATIRATVYNNQGQAVASGGPWDCFAHSGSIANVPAGSNRVLIAEALDGSGNLKMWAYKGGIVIENGKQADVGEITVADSGPMTYVQGGCFQMGDFVGDGEANERPVHEVCVDNFFMDIFELSYFRANPLVSGVGNNCDRNYNTCPALMNWETANAACVKVGKRLPTEAEWEFVAREKGRNVKYGTGQDSVDCGTAWVPGCLVGDAKRFAVLGYVPMTPVESFKPNALGFYQMSGNAREWVADWYDAGYYSSSPKQNPKGPASGSARVTRGGGLNDTSINMSRTTARNPVNPQEARTGVRCAL